ncbi:MAG TPA: YqgE/AlgH family protein [Gaiellaceae bacterium]|nr:YqgE/AlgH family protein [Gaiellaceae bacterium]
MTVESLKGKLLFSAPALFDPNFRRTVVLVAEHGEDGAMGIVLNRPSETTVGEAVPDLADVAGADSPVFVGGPVQPQAVLVLAEFEEPAQAATVVVGDIGFARADGDLDELARATRRARVFAGYSGWSPGQLEAELEDDSWLVEPVEDVDLLADPEEDLFRSALDTKGGSYRILALLPDDPRAN